MVFTLDHKPHDLCGNATNLPGLKKGVNDYIKKKKKKSRWACLKNMIFYK